MPFYKSVRKYDEQEQDSLMYTLGFTIRKAISVASGVLVPHVGFSFMRQVKNKTRAVVASSQTGSLELQTDDPDENQAVANIDISYVAAGGGYSYL